MTILLLENERDEITYIKKQLSGSGHAVLPFRQVNAAMKELDKKHSSITHAILDLHVPLGGVTIDSKLGTYLKRLGEPDDTLLSGLALLLYIIDVKDSLAVLVISDAIKTLECSGLTDDERSKFCTLDKDDPDYESKLQKFVKDGGA